MKLQVFDYNPREKVQTDKHREHSGVSVSYVEPVRLLSSIVSV